MYKLLIFCLLASCASMKQDDPKPLFEKATAVNAYLSIFKLHPDYSSFLEKTKSDLTKTLPKYTDQGDLNSCSAFSVANALEHVYFHKYGKFFNSSKLFLYYNSRDNKNKDDGADVRDAILAMMTKGVTTVRYWPYIEQNYKQKPPESAYSSALSYRASKAYKVANEDVIKALSNGYPVIVSCTIYEQFHSLNADNFVMTLPGKKDKEAGEHAMIIVGHDDKTQLYLINNSWGEDWGHNGTCYMPYSYMTSNKFINACWIIDYVK